LWKLTADWAPHFATAKLVDGIDSYVSATLKAILKSVNSNDSLCLSWSQQLPHTSFPFNYILKIYKI
jgi:hypothetical protein